MFLSDYYALRKGWRGGGSAGGMRIQLQIRGNSPASKSRSLKLNKFISFILTGMEGLTSDSRDAAE